MGENTQFFHYVPINLWITALFSGVRISLVELIFMRIRKVPPSVVVNALITATKAGLKITTSEIETHYLAGGHVPSVIKALISADKANIGLSFKQATAIDLAGRKRVSREAHRRGFTSSMATRTCISSAIAEARTARSQRETDGKTGPSMTRR